MNSKSPNSYQQDGLQAVSHSGLEVYQKTLPPYLATQDQISDKEAHEKDQAEKPSTAIGLSKQTLWILLAILAVLIVALIGTLAGVLATRKNNPASSQPNPSPSGTIASAIPNPNPTQNTASPIQTTIKDGLKGYRACPSTNERNYTTVSTPGQPGQTFRIRCSWLPRFDKRENATGNAFHEDVDSLEKCIEICADYNARNGTDKAGPCRVVSWRWSRETNFWRRCWGGFGPAAEDQLWQGVFTNSSDFSEAPVDTAILPF